MRSFALCLFLFYSLFLSAQNQPPVVTIQGIELDEEAQALTLTYDLDGPEGGEAEISFLASDDGGQYFRLNTGSASGDIGFPVAPGTGRQISWNYTGSIREVGEYVLKIVADGRYEIDIQEMVEQVDSNRLRERLASLAGVRNFITGRDKLNQTRDTLEQSFREYGLITYRQHFPYSIGGQNIIGTLPGTVQDEAIIIIDGHYDTVSNSPGADDNGSAVAGVLEAARILSQYRFAKSLRFIGFDFEEAGLRGSRHYVNNLAADENTEAVINLEMIGYYTEEPNSQEVPDGFELLFPEIHQELSDNEFRGDFIASFGLSRDEALNTAITEAAAQYVPELKHYNVSTIATLVPSDFTRSDHAPFWQAGIPAIMVTDGADFRNPHYHRNSDTLGTINFTFMSQVVRTTIAAAAKLAGLQHSSEATATVQITTGTDHLHQLDCHFSLSPNPARGAVYLRFSQCAAQQLNVEWLNSMGQSVQAERILHTSGGAELPTAGLIPGVYWLRLSDGEHFSTRRVVIR